MYSYRFNLRLTLAKQGIFLLDLLLANYLRTLKKLSGGSLGKMGTREKVGSYI